MTMQFVSDRTKGEILRFLRDPNARELSYTEERDHTCLLIKSEYNAETDFLYLLRAYDNDKAHQTGLNAEYAGIYSRLLDHVFDADYAFSKAIGETQSASELLSDTSRAVKEAVIRLVGGKPIVASDDAEPVRDNRDYFLEHGARNEALKCFYESNSAPEFEPHIQINRLTTPDFVMAINHPKKVVEELTLRYIRKSANAINERLWQLDIVRKRLAMLEATPGEHHNRRKIAGCIDTVTMKMVNIVIEKESHRLSCKIAASTLKRANDTDYITWYLDAKSRKAFEAIFGRGARLFASDIVQITYGRKVLYEKTKL